jgi:hypothetical protein
LAKKDITGGSQALLALIKPDAPIFRIHESGDFFCQEYVDMWTVVIAARPNTSFWVYTREFTLDYSQMLKLPNLTFWASTDPFNQREATAFVEKHQGRIKHAFGPIMTEEELPAGAVFCPVTTHKLKTDGACAKCKLCVVPNRTPKHIAFLRH